MEQPNPDQTQPAPNAADAAAPAPEPTLDERLAAAEAKVTEHYDLFLRAKAEGENIRKRAQEDIAKAHKYAVESLAVELLPVRDSLEAALNTPNASPDTLRSGVELTLKQLVAVFEKSQLREINPAGEKFNPHHHQAIGSVESEQAPNTVVTVMQKGYLLADRVVRPALVTVAKAKESA